MKKLYWIIGGLTVVFLAVSVIIYIAALNCMIANFPSPSELKEYQLYEKKIDLCDKHIRFLLEKSDKLRKNGHHTAANEAIDEADVYIAQRKTALKEWRHFLNTRKYMCFNGFQKSLIYKVNNIFCGAISFALIFWGLATLIVYFFSLKKKC